MRNKNNCSATLLDIFDNAAEPINISARQGRSWFIEQQHLRLTKNRTRNFEFLTDGQFEVTDQRTGINKTKAECRQMIMSETFGHFGVDNSPGRKRLERQQQILRNGQVANLGHFLERGLKSEFLRSARRVDGTYLAGHLDTPRIRSYQPAQYFYQRRLAGAVLPQ